MTIPPPTDFLSASEHFENLDLRSLGVKKDDDVDAGFRSLIEAVSFFEFDEGRPDPFVCATYCLHIVGFLTFSAHSRGEASEFYQFRKILNRHLWSHYLVAHTSDVAVISHPNRLDREATDAIREAVDFVCSDPDVLTKMVMTR